MNPYLHLSLRILRIASLNLGLHREVTGRRNSNWSSNRNIKQKPGRSDSAFIHLLALHFDARNSLGPTAPYLFQRWFLCFYWHWVTLLSSKIAKYINNKFLILSVISKVQRENTMCLTALVIVLSRFSQISFLKIWCIPFLKFCRFFRIGIKRQKREAEEFLCWRRTF